MFKIYLDTCCYNRPFDDQIQDKIRIESESVISILYRCERGSWNLFGSEVIDHELSNNTDTVKRFKSQTLYKIALNNIITLNDDIINRALCLEKVGLKAFDSLHLACAEYAKVDILTTVDIKFIKSAARSDTFINVENPVNWLMEVMKNE